MQVLLLVAHGSRRAQSNEEIRVLTKHLADAAKSKFNRVACAFLELAEPSIPQGIQDCIDTGAKEITILPYFLAAGNHVAKDIPTAVEIKSREHPEVIIRVTDYIGKYHDMPNILLKMVE